MRAIPSPGLGWTLAFVVVAALASLPFLATDYVRSFFLILLMHVALALSWNMTSGYTGYLSFGHGIFFGLGAYAFAILVDGVGCPWPIAMVLAGVLSALCAFALGLVFMRVRIRVAYFAIATLGLNEIAKAIVANADWLGGSHGLTLPPSPGRFTLYFVLLGIVCAVAAVSYWLDRSTFGLGLKAILQDEEAAESTGVPTFHCKLLVFVVSAFFPGVVGAVVGWHWSYIDPYMAFDLVISFDMSVMAVFGGIGTFWGPILGAIVMGGFGEFLWVHVPNLHGLIYGILIAVMVVLAPGGLMQILGTIKRGTRERRAQLRPQSAEPVA
jgi:branched-chain amino acid transport system permease protein